MATQIIIQQVGPLPITVQFQAFGDEAMCLEVNGSVWSTSTEQMIGISISLDGVDIGQASIFSNGSNTHRPVVPAYIPITLSQEQHTLTLSALDAETTSDYNDLYTAVIHY